MLNRLLLSILSQQSSDKKPQARAMTEDDFENVSTYKGWVAPLRYLLALRYLKHKQRVLSWFKAQKIYPIHDGHFKDILIAQISGKPLDALSLDAHNRSQPYYQHQHQQRATPLVAQGLQSLFVYPILLASLLFGIYSLNHWQQQQRLENIFANHLPYFSDLLHQRLLLKHNSSAETLDKIDIVIAKQQKQILAELPEKDGLRDLLQKQLNQLKDSATSSKEIMLGFKAVNTLFDEIGLPFYLSPKSYSMPCSSLIDAPVEQLMMLKKMEELMSNNNPERCRTTMMTAYKVGKRNALYYNEKTDKRVDEENTHTELPLFSVKRIDKVPAIDSALGLTFKDRGIGSIILTEQIKDFAQESILPALTFQGRNYIIPYWMQGYYEVEEAITKGYQKDINDIYTDKAERRKVKKIVKKLIKNKNQMQNAKLKQSLAQTNSVGDESVFGNGFDAISVLLNKDKKANSKPKINRITEDDLALLKKLEEALIPSIEYHEAYHQIDKSQWKPPFWLDSTFKGKLSENQIGHTLEELGAYLSQLANTEKGHDIWLSKLLIFSLNPMTKGQSEYYASSIILKTMESLYLRKPIKVDYNATVDEKVLIYKTLIKMNKTQIRLLSNTAYKILFERETPLLYER